MKFPFIVLIGLFLANSIWGQQKINPIQNHHSSEIIKVIESIEKYEQLPCLEEYEINNLSHNWNDLLELEILTTEKQAIELLKHSNKFVKALAFFSLVLKKEVKIFPILMSNMHHLELIEIDSNSDECILYNEKLSDLFITLSFISKELSDDEKTELKRKVIKENIKIDSRDTYLFMSEPKDSLYQDIRNIATEENNKYAIYALSKYKRAQDIFLIKNLLESKDSKYWGFMSVIKYPAHEFLPYIEKYLKQEIRRKRRLEFTTYREAYIALIKYDSQESFEIVEYVLDNCNKRVIDFHKKYISNALKKYPLERYKSILKELELDY